MLIVGLAQLALNISESEERGLDDLVAAGTAVMCG
jgi:hypothetical protein